MAMGLFFQILLALSVQGRLWKFLLFFSFLLSFFLQHYMKLIASTWVSSCSLYKWLETVSSTFLSSPPCPQRKTCTSLSPVLVRLFFHCDKCPKKPTEGKKDLFWFMGSEVFARCDREGVLGQSCSHHGNHEADINTCPGRFSFLTPFLSGASAYGMVQLTFRACPSP